MIVLGRTTAVVLILVSLIGNGLRWGWEWGSVLLMIYPAANAVLILIATEILAELRKRIRS